MQIENSYWLRGELRVKRFCVHHFISIYLYIYNFFGLFPFVGGGREETYSKSASGAVSQRTPDIREWNGCEALPFQHLYHLARSLIFHPVMETQDE